MSPLMSAGLELMLVGMGTVFVFLTLLIVTTQAMSKIVLRFFPQAQQDVRRPGGEVSGSQADEEVAAIMAAIAQHRRR